jgi:tRNA(fMet)-specific endonuclease VapC
LIYLLDTNAVVALLRDRPTCVRARFRAAVAADASIIVSTVALFELWYGVARSERPEHNAERLRAFLSGDIGVLPFDQADSVLAGELRVKLERQGTMIGPYDLMIAAQSLRTGATLSTANVSEFSRVPGLIWEDWTVAG